MNEEQLIATLQACYFGDRGAFNKMLKEYKKIQKQNTELKERDLIIAMELEKLQNNWNELKEWAKDGMKNSLHIPYECELDFEDVLHKMQEIEGGVDNE